MPQHIDACDSEFRDLPEHSITAAHRRRRWDLAEKMHRRNRTDDSDSLPPCLEVICQRPGEAGILLAVRRLLPFHEDGVTVISDSGPLFGERMLPDELDKWDTIIRPGQVACLTDRWFNRIRPQLPAPNLPGTGDFHASEIPEGSALYDASKLWSTFIEDLEEKMERVLDQGCHVVLVNTSGPFEPPWLDMISAPLVIVRISDLSVKSFADGHCVMTTIEVDDRTGGGVIRSPKATHSYDRLNRSELLDALLLTDVGGYELEAGA